MPKNVMKLIKPSPHRARNDFDLSHRHVMSANFGELIPATCIETVPGDHIEIKCADLLRAIPLVTSPFLRAKQHLEAWFVPYRDLWHNFNNFIAQKQEPASSALKYWLYAPSAPLWALYDALDNASAPNDTDIVGRNIKLGGDRILNYLGYSDVTHPAGSDMNDYLSVNLWRLAAYNYIWYNEYRQSYFDAGNNSWTSPQPNQAAIFNFDDLTCNSFATAEITDTNRLRAMCQMRYRCWKKDLYTGLMSSTQFGAVSTQGLNITLSDGRVLGATSASSNITYNSVGQRSSSDTTAPESVFGVLPSGQTINFRTSPQIAVGNFDILALRRSEAIQIWRENSMRAGNRISDNFRAHYGVESDFRDHRPTFLGSVSSPLNIGDVMTTANSSTGINDTVGDIAGKGLSSMDEYLCKFDAKDFGVIMVIFSILPEAEYNAQGVDRMNQLSSYEDYFIPEFENLGFEAVDITNFLAKKPSLANVVGYAPRYFGYKQKMDKCFDLFMTGGINAPWCSPKYDVTAALAPTYVATHLPLSTLYVNPKVFDVNFSVGVDVSPQFLCDFYFDVDAVRPMSVMGLPFS